MVKEFRDYNKKSDDSKDHERDEYDKKKILEEEKNCPECEESAVIEVEERGEQVCDNCGTIISEKIVDQGPEWRAFNNEERESKKRTGDPIDKNMHDKGLTTTIDWKDKDAYGKMISSKQRNKMARLRKWQARNRASNSRERNLRFALSEIDRMSASTNIPEKGKNLACDLYKQALEKDIIRGRSIEGVATACLYISCRSLQIPRSLGEISKTSRVDMKEVGRTYRYMVKELDNLNLSPVDPKGYIPRYTSQLGLDKEVEHLANYIVDETKKEGLLSGKSPTGFASAAIYTASKKLLDEDEIPTQKEFSKVADVTEVTIRNRHNEQMEFFEENLSVEEAFKDEQIKKN